MSDESTSAYKWLSPKQITDEFNISRDTLQALRTNGGGCRFSKIGRKTVRYLRSEFGAWILGCGSDVPVPTNAAPPFVGSLTAAADRLGALQIAANSLAMLTPGGVAIPGAKALAAGLGREVEVLRTMTGEGGAA